jgi:putative hemolysin
MEILLLLALILFNGFFAMSEIALITARRARLKKLAEAGDRRAARAIELGEQPTRFLSTIQIGITSIGVLNGIVGEATFADPLARWLSSLGMPGDLAGFAAIGLIVVIITYVTIVLGELVPKRLGQLGPERLARLVARPMQVLATVTRPFVFLLSTSTELILRLLRVRSTDARVVTEEEIHAVLEEGSAAGVIEKSEHAMVRNVFRLEDRLVTTLMTPRSDIVYLDVNDPLDRNLAKIRESGHSRFPVTRGRFSEVLGVVNAKQLLAQALRGQLPDLTASLEQPAYVPDSQSGMELLEAFRSSQIQMALVVDEYGQIRGLVTVQDLIEAIAGEFRSGPEDEAWAIQRADGSWLLDGTIPVPELQEHLALKSVPDGEAESYNTLSGMFQLLLDRLPRTGDIVEWQGWSFEIVDMDGRRIDKVLATRQPGEMVAATAARRVAPPG